MPTLRSPCWDPPVASLVGRPPENENVFYSRAMADYRLLIGGERVPVPGARTGSSPGDRADVGEAPEASVEQAQQATEAAAAVLPAWSRTKPEERAELLNRAADLLRDRMEDLIPLVQAETGATQRVASTMQVPTCIERLRRYAKGAPTDHDPATALADAVDRAGRRRAHRRDRPPPTGRCGACITPYNFPIVNMAGKVGPALAMGNTVVVKPAPTGSARHCLRRAARRGRLPDGVVNVVTGRPDREAITSSPHVDMVSFTGSTSVGQRIARSAAGR